MEFQVRRGKGQQEFYWTIAEGLDILAKSEMLANWGHAWEIANKVKNQTWAFSFTSFQSQLDRKWRWRITGGNSEKVVSSTGAFDSEWEANAERDRVQKAAPYAIVKDYTS